MKQQFTHTALRAAAIVFCAAFVAACASGPKSVAPTASTLAPMPKPATEPIGEVVQTLANGQPESRTFTGLAGNVGSYERSDGCSWTEEVWSFAPAMTYAGCGGSDGSQTVSATIGEIWPLRVGNSVSYEYTGRNERGDDWSSTRTCSVAETATIEAAGGSYDTYKVVCNDSFDRRTYFIAPSIGRTVYFERIRKRGGDRRVVEFLSASGS